jgi:hypothetical protein
VYVYVCGVRDRRSGFISGGEGVKGEGEGGGFPLSSPSYLDITQALREVALDDTHRIIHHTFPNESALQKRA